MSCEEARARYIETYDKSVPPDLTPVAYGAVLSRGTYLAGCGVPSDMTVSICAAVQNGRVVGVTVTTNPSSAGIARCVAVAVRGLSFPSHPRLDVTNTRFDAVASAPANADEAEAPTPPDPKTGPQTQAPSPDYVWTEGHWTWHAAERAYVWIPEQWVSAYAPTEPPLPKADALTHPPTRKHVWVKGFWRWDGNDWSWVAGHWTFRAGHRWIDGHWNKDGARWKWVPGRWEQG
jgi:hypothetical protein